MDNRCIICGAMIPEGRMICPMCSPKERTSNCSDCLYLYVDESLYEWQCGAGNEIVVDSNCIKPKSKSCNKFRRTT